MWSQLRHALARFWHRSREGPPKQLRSTNARARFWAEVREGEREAEDASREGRSARVSHACATGTNEMLRQRCANDNHGRAVVTVRFCPNCGVVVNGNIARRPAPREPRADAPRAEHLLCRLRPATPPGALVTIERA